MMLLVIVAVLSYMFKLTIVLQVHYQEVILLHTQSNFRNILLLHIYKHTILDRGHSDILQFSFFSFFFFLEVLVVGNSLCIP